VGGTQDLKIGEPRRINFKMEESGFHILFRNRRELGRSRIIRGGDTQTEKGKIFRDFLEV